MFAYLQEKIKPYYDKLINRETITYIIAGVLTTVINYISYYWFCRILGIETLVANIIAWVIAVSFAYLINARWVFQSKKTGLRSEVDKIMKFFGARICSLALEEAGMLLFVTLLDLNDLIVKACLNILVIVVNYFFSKLIIFNKA